MNPVRSLLNKLFQGLDTSFLSKLFHTDDETIPPEMKNNLLPIVTMVDANVNMLRDPVQTNNLHINRLMTLAGRLMGNKVTPTAIVEETSFGNPQTLHFWYETQPQRKVVTAADMPPTPKELGVIMIPFNWYHMCLEDLYMQLGGMVFVSSQAADYWMGRMIPPSHTLERAWAYEAEYLLTLLKQYRNFKPNKYQRHILDHSPKGLRSLPPGLYYKLKPYQKDDFAKLEAHYGALPSITHS